MRAAAVVTLLALCAAPGAPGAPAARPAPADPPPRQLVAPKLGRYFGPFTGCAILHDLARNETIRVNPERCGQRVSPCSTFKIWHSLVALETGVLPDENTAIEWDGTQRQIAAWNRDHTLASAFKESAVWFYQAVAERIGQQRMEYWLNKVPYGDRNMSGGLTTFWLSSSLTIAPDEQALFLRDFLLGRLPFREDVQAAVRRIMVQETRPDGAVLSGKTGSGQTHDGRALGWFVGSVSGPGGGGDGGDGAAAGGDGAAAGGAADRAEGADAVDGASGGDTAARGGAADRADGAAGAEGRRGRPQPGHIVIVEIDGARADGRAAREIALNILADRELW